MARAEFNRFVVNRFVLLRSEAKVKEGLIQIVVDKVFECSMWENEEKCFKYINELEELVFKDKLLQNDMDAVILSFLGINKDPDDMIFEEFANVYVIAQRAMQFQQGSTRGAVFYPPKAKEIETDERGRPIIIARTNMTLDFPLQYGVSQLEENQNEAVANLKRSMQEQKQRRG